jgi:hypothetical protein
MASSLDRFLYVENAEEVDWDLIDKLDNTHARASCKTPSLNIATQSLNTNR